jgi:hypothetical protein
MASDGFLNVDLEVGARTRAALAPLLDALEGTMFELFRGRLRGLYRAHYEIIGCARDASTTIRALAEAIEALRPPARRAWNAAALRDFNVGVELARGVKNIELAVDADAVQRVASLGGRIVITAYQEAAMRSKPRTS